MLDKNYFSITAKQQPLCWKKGLCVECRASLLGVSCELSWKNGLFDGCCDSFTARKDSALGVVLPYWKKGLFVVCRVHTISRFLLRPVLRF